jgi:hypothetical protein
MRVDLNALALLIAVAGLAGVRIIEALAKLLRRKRISLRRADMAGPRGEKK